MDEAAFRIQLAGDDSFLVSLFGHCSLYFLGSSTPTKLKT